MFKEFKETAISFKELNINMYKNKIPLRQLSVKVGSKERIPVRLMIQLVLYFFLSDI